MSLITLLGECTPEDADEDIRDYLLECVLQTEACPFSNTQVTTYRQKWIAEYLDLFGGANLAALLSRPIPHPTDNLFQGNQWQLVKDGDPRAYQLYKRHYSAGKNYKGRKKENKRFVGPGERIVLLTTHCDALFVWRLEKYRQDQQAGVNCALFRNESRRLSSELILEAEAFARRRWPLVSRFFTFVDASRVRSANPGYCFQRAGWQKLKKRTREGLYILEKICLPLSVVQLEWQKETD